MIASQHLLKADDGIDHLNANREIPINNSLNLETEESDSMTSKSSNVDMNTIDEQKFPMNVVNDDDYFPSSSGKLLSSLTECITTHSHLTIQEKEAVTFIIVKVKEPLSLTMKKHYLPFCSWLVAIVIIAMVTFLLIKKMKYSTTLRWR